MASSAVEDNQPLQEEKPTLTSEQANDIGTVYYNGLRTTLASYLLERLLMALALQIVNDSTDSDGQFQYEKAKHVLDEFKEKSKGCFEQKRQVITKEDVYKEIRDEAKNLPHKIGDDQKTSLEKIKALDNLIFKMLEKQPKNTEEELKEDGTQEDRDKKLIDGIPKEHRIMKLLEETENLSNGTCQDNIRSLEKLRKHIHEISDAWKSAKDPSQHYNNLLSEAENLLNGTYDNKVESLKKITYLGQLISNDSEKRRRKKPQELVDLGAKITRKAKHKISDDSNSLFDFARKRLKQELDCMLPSEDRMPPSEDRMPPSEDHMLPSEDRMLPSEDRMLPSEDRMPPSEDCMLPSEDRIPKSEERTLLPGVCKMIRVAAVYEECLCMEPCWYNFVKNKIRELLFGDKTIDKKFDAGDTAHPQNPMDLIKYLFLDRHQAAHSGSSGKTTSIETFIKQLDYVDELLHPYFQDSRSAEMSDEDEKKNLKLLFGDCNAIKVIDETYTDMKATYPNFEKKVKDLFKSLEDGVSDAEDEEAWSLAKMYYDHHPNSCEDNGYYTMLLKRIKNHQKILDNHVQEDYQPLKDLKALHELDLTAPEKLDESVLHVLFGQRLQELVWLHEQQQQQRILCDRCMHLLHYTDAFERDNIYQFVEHYLITDLDLDPYLAELHD